MYVLGVGSVLWNDSNNYTGIKRVVRINFDKDVDLNELIWDDGSSSLYQDWTSGHGYSAPLTTNTGTTTTHQNISACCYINSTNYSSWFLFIIWSSWNVIVNYICSYILSIRNTCTTYACICIVFTC